MTQENKKKRNSKKQITFYETFDDEIVRIDEEVSYIEDEITGGPRESFAPIPVIPGFYTLTDAFENARLRMEAEENSEKEEDGLNEEAGSVPQTEKDSTMQPHNPMIRAVTPGHFTRKTRTGRPDPYGKTERAESAAHQGKKNRTEFSEKQKKHFIAAGELIEELADEEPATEGFYSQEQLKRQTESFDSVLDETMKNLITEEEYSKVSIS